jgi:hypothetical protein
VKRLTLDSYRDVVMRLLRRRAGSDVYIWRLHDGDDNSQVAARVLSIRAMDGYVAKGEPNVGNRLLVHALVKFDTKQVHLPSSTWIAVASILILCFRPLESADIFQERRTTGERAGAQESSGIFDSREAYVVRHAMDDTGSGL